jgi:hypothetical protein
MNEIVRSTIAFFSRYTNCIQGGERCDN